MVLLTISGLGAERDVLLSGLGDLLGRHDVVLGDLGENGIGDREGLGRSSRYRRISLWWRFVLEGLVSGHLWKKAVLVGRMAGWKP